MSVGVRVRVRVRERVTFFSAGLAAAAEGMGAVGILGLVKSSAEAMPPRRSAAVSGMYSGASYCGTVEGSQVGTSGAVAWLGLGSGLGLGLGVRV